MLASAAVFGWRLVGAIPARPPVRATIQRGVSLNLPGVDWGTAEINVALVTRSTCPASNGNLALYKELARRTHALGRSRFVVITNEPLPQLHSWLSAAAVSDYVAVRSFDPESLGLSWSPMLLSISASGTVTNVISGGVRPVAYAETIDQLLGNGGIPSPFTSDQRVKVR